MCAWQVERGYWVALGFALGVSFTALCSLLMRAA